VTATAPSGVDETVASGFGVHVPTMFSGEEFGQIRVH
jgi:hypothetical protein